MPACGAISCAPRPACRALGVAPATLYRHLRPPKPKTPRLRVTLARALSTCERDAVLAELHSERFSDASPAAIVATLLDEGRYLASERTMYRVLSEESEVRERATSGSTTSFGTRLRRCEGLGLAVARSAVRR